MEDLKKALKEKLKDPVKVAVLGIGSHLRGDDAVGALIAEELLEFSKTNKAAVPFEVFLGETAPENQTGAIKRYQPSHIIIIDAADLGKEPGSFAIVDPEDEQSCGSFSTHRMPCKVLIKYLKEYIDCKVVMIGIQPKDISFGAQLSAQAREAVSLISGELIKTLAK